MNDDLDLIASLNQGPKHLEVRRGRGQPGKPSSPKQQATIP